MIKICIALLIASYSVRSQAQSIEDMFLDVPGEMIGFKKGADKEEKKKLISEIDNKNGFIALKSENDMELAKFTLKGEEPILAVAETSYADGNTLEKRLTFLTKVSGKWTDVTDRYLKEIPGLVIDAFSMQKCGVAISDSASGTYRYKLPRKGRTIKAVAESDVLLKPCKGDLFHLEFDSMRLAPNNNWHDYMIMKFAS